MNVTITVLGRSANDVSFSELASTMLVVDAAPVACTLAVPPVAVGQELALRISADDDVVVQLGQWLDPASRPTPAPAPYTRASYVAWGNAPRQIPFNAGNSIVLARPGEAAAV